MKTATEIREKCNVDKEEPVRKKNVKNKNKKRTSDEKGEEEIKTKRNRNLKGNEEDLKLKFLQYIKEKWKPFHYYKCQCKAVFVAYEEALAHVNQPECKMPSNKKVKESKCYICNEVFPSVSARTKHFQQNHQEPATCSKCPNVEFKSRSNLNRHMKTVHEENNFACNQCDKKFNRKDILARHKQTLHRNVNVNRFDEEQNSFQEDEIEENPYYTNEDPEVEEEPMDHSDNIPGDN